MEVAIKTRNQLPRVSHFRRIGPIFNFFTPENYDKSFPKKDKSAHS